MATLDLRGLLTLRVSLDLSPTASDEDDAGDEVVFRQKSLMRLDSH
jgi:hypothetical protein